MNIEAGDVLRELDHQHARYARQWKASAAAHHAEGDYGWLAAGVDAHERVLEIGCGSGHGTLELLKRGHRVIAVEENPHCIQATKELLKQNGMRAEVVLRADPKVVHIDGGRIVYDSAYRPIGTTVDADCILVEGDALADPELMDWLKARAPFDAIICWMLGTHQFRGLNRVVAEREIQDNWQYRVLVQNSVYELADEILRSGGILNVADRGETPSTAKVYEGLVQHHREQASVTSLRVSADVRHKPYTVGSVEGGVPMIVSPPNDGSTFDREFTQSLCAVTSVKP